MKVIKHDLGKFDELHILPLADTHIGDIHSDFKRLREQLDWVLAEENRFVILNGDLWTWRCATASAISTRRI